MWTLVMWTATFRPHILLVFIRQWGRLVTCHLLSRMLCCDWCILIPTVVVCCSLSSPLSYDSCVVVFLDRLMKTSSMQLKHRHPHHKWPHCETNENTDYSCTPPQWITTTFFTTLKESFKLVPVLAKTLRTLGNKTQNILATKAALNFSEPYSRIQLAQLTNHSICTNWEIWLSNRPQVCMVCGLINRMGYW